MGAEKVQAFAHLHNLLQQLQDAEYLLAHGPKRIAVAKKKVVAAEEACANQKETIKQLRLNADKSQMNLKTREAEVAKLNMKLNEASSNKEYEIIQNKIASEKEEDARLEDEILGLLDEVDGASSELERLQQELADQETKTKDIEADVQKREPGLKADVERLEGEIKEAESVISGGDSVTTYRRLRAAQGASALSPVEDSYCVECNSQVTPQDAVRLNLGEFVLCRACGRILYRGKNEEE